MDGIGWLPVLYKMAVTNLNDFQYVAKRDEMKIVDSMYFLDTIISAWERKSTSWEIEDIYCSGENHFGEVWLYTITKGNRRVVLVRFILIVIIYYKPPLSTEYQAPSHPAPSPR